jgi:hypothetical protein
LGPSSNSQVVGRASGSSDKRPTVTCWVRPSGSGALDQDFIGRQVEMPVRQMNGEARQFAVTGQDVTDVCEAVEIAARGDACD